MIDPGLLEIAANAFALLFVVIDPMGVAPLFVALTVGGDAAFKRKMALRSTTIAALVLVVFALIGQPLLSAMGIGLPAFRIAGGLLLLSIAFEMLFQKRTQRREQTAQQAWHDRDDPEDVSVFPLAMPLLAGPGAITAVLLLVARHEGHLAAQAVVLGTVIFVLLVAYGLFRIAGWIERVIGKTVTNVVTRLLGLITAALAVQFVLDGFAAWMSGAGLLAAGHGGG